jgi:cell division protein FtsI/penicillin-binding protein 2
MKWRYRFTLFSFITLFIIIDARLFYWQIVRADEIAELGRSQYGAEVKLMPKRGQIKTSDGFAIAANKISYLVYANPKVVKEKEKTSDLLSSLLKLESSTISAQLDRDSFWSPLKTNVDEKTKNKIESLKLAGIGFEEKPDRFYPEASMAAKVLGFVGKDKDANPQGYFGLEGYYDRQLRGKAGISLQMRDAWGNPIADKLKEFTGQIDGRSLTLHIDRSLQYIVEQELKKGIVRYGAESGMVGIIDPKTGGVIAMSSFPGYDPKSYQEYSEELYKNPFISDTYEPGSTFKPIIMAGAMESGLVKPDTICAICGEPFETGGFTIKTWNDKYKADSTMIDVIKNSDNIGMVFVGQKLGLSRLIDYLKKFRLDIQTGIDLQGESAPKLKEKNLWYDIDLATVTFGQGITVTPVQLLSAFSAIANSGKIMEPHIVSQVETADGEIIKIPPKELSAPISPKTARIMTEMLVNAVDHGESKWAKPKGYRIAGKTGTAQIALAGRYDPNKTIASFIGYAPASDPRFVMLVILNKPSTSIYGSETAAPLFFNIAGKLLTYYNIPPTETVITTPEPARTFEQETDISPSLSPDLTISPEATEVGSF